MLKWTVCQRAHTAHAPAVRTPSAASMTATIPASSSSSSSSELAACYAIRRAAAKLSMARRSCGPQLGSSQSQDSATDTETRGGRRVARRSARRHRDQQQSGDKENADTPEQLFSPRTRDSVYMRLDAVPIALRDVSNLEPSTPTSPPSSVSRRLTKTPESGKKRSRSQCRDITNIPARHSLDQPLSRSAGRAPLSQVSPPGRLSLTPEVKRSRSHQKKKMIQMYEDDKKEVRLERKTMESTATQEAQLKIIPKQRTTSTGVARIIQSRELIPRSHKIPGRSGNKRPRRRKSCTPRFVRPEVETASDAAREAIVVPLETTREILDAAKTPSPPVDVSPKTSPSKSQSLPRCPAVSEPEILVADRTKNPPTSATNIANLLSNSESGSPGTPTTVSPMQIEYSPCPLRTTQSLLALRRRLFDSSVLEPNVSSGCLMHRDHPDQNPKQPSVDVEKQPSKSSSKSRKDLPSTPKSGVPCLPLTTPLIEAFNRWHRLHETGYFPEGTLPSGVVPPLDKPLSTIDKRRRSLASPSNVSPLASRMAWLRVQRGPDAEKNPTCYPFPPYGRNGRYLSGGPPSHHASSPNLFFEETPTITKSSLAGTRRRRLSSSSGSVSTICEDAVNPLTTSKDTCFRIPSIPSDAKRLRTSCSSLRRRMSFSGKDASSLASDTLSLLNHGPVSSVSSSSLCSLFPGYRPSSVASSLTDIPTITSSPLADLTSSSLRRQRRRKTTLTDLDGIEQVINKDLNGLSLAFSCPQISSEGSSTPPGNSSSGYSSSTTTEPMFGAISTRRRSYSAGAQFQEDFLDDPVPGTSPVTASSKRYGLTLPTGIPSPESPENGTVLDCGTILDSKFICSTPLLLSGAVVPSKCTESQKLIKGDAGDDSISTSMRVNRGSPLCSDDTWDSHCVQKVVNTPSHEDRLNDLPENGESSLPAPSSPTALVERRCRSRRGLLFASPVDNAVQVVTDNALIRDQTPPSVSSSYASSSTSSCRSRRRSTPWKKTSKEILPGELELSISGEANRLIVHVVRGSNLKRPGGDSSNAYVKVSLVAGATEEKTFQRTCVHRDSDQPFFDHKFSFEVEEADLEKRVLISVWHRDRPKRRSEFLGCMSFAVKHAVKKEVSGTFRLLPQGAGRAQNAPAPAPAIAPLPAPAVPSSQIEARTTTDAANTNIQNDAAPAERRKTMLSSRTMETVSCSVDRSEDSSFLRHLELEAPETQSIICIGRPGSGPGQGGRPPPPPGRTPFTTTHRLQRAPSGGFGFSVAWTHPPRVERVEPGLSAEQAGIRPGDYVIFVEKQNVVTVPEEQVLQLIRSCGNQLTLEIYRRSSLNGMVPQSKSTPAVSSVAKSSVPASSSTCSALLAKVVTASAVAAPSIPTSPPSASQRPAPAPSPAPPRPSTACSGTTVGTTASDMGKRRLNLPQVTFTSEVGQPDREDAQKRAVYQLLSKEQTYSLALQFGVSRFLAPLSERRDLLSPADHHTLFQNIQEILCLTDQLLEQLVREDGEALVNSVARVYLAAVPQLTTAYHRYCSGLKRADSLLVSKTRNPEFVRMLNEPAVPRRRPDLTTFLHKPLEHYREILKLLQTVLNFTKHSDDEYTTLSQIVHELQTAYRCLTTESGLMEPEGEGRPLLTVQDIESRLVFTKCKPFTLSAPGRRWIFGGELVRVEGRSERRYWVLLFSDLLLFAQVSRDRVLFITEEPLRLLSITQAAFSVKRRAAEFRLMVDTSTSPSPPGPGPGGETSKKARKGDRRRSIILRAPNAELKSVWQNLIQRQIIYLNTVRGGTPAGSPLDSPDLPSLSLATADSLPPGRRPTGHQDSACGSGPSGASGASPLDELIEHRCRQLGKASGAKGSAQHLARWMREQLDPEEMDHPVPPSHSEPSELWTLETLNKRSAELRMSHPPVPPRGDSRCEELEISDDSRSRSRSTTDSQATIKSTSVGSSDQKVPVCRKCQTTCLSSRTNNNNPWETISSCKAVPCTSTSANNSNTTTIIENNNTSGYYDEEPPQSGYEPPHLRGDMYYHKEIPRVRVPVDYTVHEEPEPDDDDLDKPLGLGEDCWSPWMLMAGMSMLGGAISGDPFAPAPVPPPRDATSSTTATIAPPLPRISVLPPTPSNRGGPFGVTGDQESARFRWEDQENSENSSSPSRRRRLFERREGGSEDTLDDSSSEAAEPPYRSLSSSCELHRYGTLNSLPDGLAAEDDSRPTNDGEETDEEDNAEKNTEESAGYGMASSLRGWTAKAGVFVAEKMAILERLGDDSLAAALLDRYLRPLTSTTSAETPQVLPQAQGGEDSGTTSGCTSGEEIWGTPTSGGDMDDEFGSPLGHEFHSFPDSPPDSAASILIAEEEAEQLMMEELLTSAALVGHRLFPGTMAAVRRRLEPLPEEDESRAGPESTPSSPASDQETADSDDVASMISDTPSHIGAGRPGCERARLRVQSYRKQQQQQQQLLKQQSQTQQAHSGFFARLRLRRNREEPQHAKRNKLLSFLSRSSKTDGAPAAPVPVPAPGAPSPARSAVMSTCTMMTSSTSSTSAPVQLAATSSPRPIMSRLFNRDAVDDVPTTLPRKMAPTDDLISSPHQSDKQADRRFWKSLGKRRSGLAQSAQVAASL